MLYKLYANVLFATVLIEKIAGVYRKLKVLLQNFMDFRTSVYFNF